MKELNKVSKIVERILQDDPRARVDDEYLVYKVVEYKNTEIAGKSFKEVMLSAREINLNIDSIRRARQKLQARNKDLKNCDLAEYRNNLQKDYIEYINS